ncbi:hypothetical protein [Georgenia muralis]|uniref:Uncharacterized protein n=1 Tax=Georgenia muralis TaxID=154117 RepID=A0A3N4Z851_9MICO|nr:hypothetical protein [Georgenia muralis]RPF28056.1 hypothetical protein EDD32_2565 [Georgenia muralis]
MPGPAILTLPVSVMLAIWLPHVDGAPSARRAARAVTGTDEPHRVLEHGGDDQPARSLAELIPRLGPVVETAAILPRPGDPMGAPAVRSAELVDAGEGVLLRRTRGGRETCAVLVPERERFGSVFEEGEMVTWSVHHDVTEHVPAPSLFLAGVDSLSQARRDIQLALTEAVETLEDLEVARERPDLADRLLDISVAGLAEPLPPIDPRRLDVLERAARLLAIVELATSDDGGARTAAQVQERRAALRAVDRAARHALSAASATRAPH